jgi:hypothetical protein
MATTPQSLTPAQVAQIVAAGRGSTVNIGGTLYGGNWADIGDGESRQEGALAGIYGSTGIDQAGQPFYSYDPSGAFTGQGTTKASQSFFGGLADAFKDPVVLAALGGAGYAGLFGGGGAAAAGLTATEAAGLGLTAAEASALGLSASEFAAAAGTAGVAGAAGTAGASGLTASQIANLARAGISVAGLIGAGNAVSNIGNNRTTTATPTPVTYSGGGAGAGYSPDYFSQVQSNYNSLMPGVPRNVASPLQNWYSTQFNPGASVTGSLFGDMAGGTPAGSMTPTTLKPITTTTTPITTTTPVITATAVTPTYTNLTKTSTATDVSKAYADFIKNSGGNTAANRKAATDYLTNLGLTQDQIGASYNAYLDTLPAAGNTYDVLNAKANAGNVTQAYSTFIKNAGGNTAANRQLATDYLKDIGVSDTLINQAYSDYLTTLPAAGNTYQELNATAAPTNIAQAYSSFVGGAGGDTAENQQTAINYLKDIGLSDEQINQAYNTYLAGTTTGGGGMMSAGQSTTGTAAAPSYTTLGASSSPRDIALAYADFVASAGGDTPANQQLAIDYLTGLGVSQDTINSAYGLFTGA